MEETLVKLKFPGMGRGIGVEVRDGTGDGTVESHIEESSESEITRAMVANHNRKGKKSGGFQSMGFSSGVFTGIMRKGYRVPTPIQRKCIPLIMDGKDVVAMARTGSGKTAAFLLPMFERLKTHSTKMGARAVILSPTRELANQTFKFAKELGRFTSLRAALVQGGDSLEDQFSTIHQNPDIIVATPGRFIHLLVEMDLFLTSVEYVVFDEADRLFEMGFAEQLQDIIRRFPESRQTLLFSATLPGMLVEFAKAGLKDPVLVRLDVDSKLSDQLKLSFLSVRAEDKPSALLYLLHGVIPSSEQTVIFTATKHHVEYLRELLELAGVSCTYIYSSLDQTARKINVAKFVSKKVSVVLVTDIAARGIDIPLLDNVINYNFPAKSKLFVHRVGRVARAGRSGSAYSLVAPDEVAYMLDLHLFLGHSLQLGVHGSSPHASGVYGTIPQSLLDQEDDLIRKLYQTSPDLHDLKRVSENSQKQYVRSRSQAAPESVKRAKKLLSPLPLHPMFEELCSTGEKEQCQLLNSLKCYKPSQTIFEINSTAKLRAKEIMRTKRQHHSAVIQTDREQKMEDLERMKTIDISSNEQDSHELVQDAFQTEHSAKEELRKRNKSKRGSVKDSSHYISHFPRDLHSEKGLSLREGKFDVQASGVTLDLDGDDETTFRRVNAVKKWDRKRKKFVGDSGEKIMKNKRIKTESGHWIKASYKSSAYQEWRDKHKVEASLTGQEEGDNNKLHQKYLSPRQRSGLRKVGGRRTQRGQGAKEPAAGRTRGGRGAKEPVGGLKSKASILKKRQKREFMERRKKMKMRNRTKQTRKK